MRRFNRYSRPRTEAEAFHAEGYGFPVSFALFSVILALNVTSAIATLISLA
jgi:hypothetical protein